MPKLIFGVDATKNTGKSNSFMHSGRRGPPTSNSSKPTHTEENIRAFEDNTDRAQPIGLENNRVEMLSKTNAKLFNYLNFEGPVASFTSRQDTKHSSLDTIAATRETGNGESENPTIRRINPNLAVHTTERTFKRQGIM